MSELEESFKVWFRENQGTEREAFKAGAAYAREQDAKICEEYGGHLFGHECAEYIRSQEGRSDTYVAGQSDGAEDCATLIREQSDE